MRDVECDSNEALNSLAVRDVRKSADPIHIENRSVTFRYKYTKDVLVHLPYEIDFSVLRGAERSRHIAATKCQLLLSTA